MNGSSAKSIVVVAQAAAADVLRAVAVATAQRWLRRDRDYVIE